MKRNSSAWLSGLLWAQQEWPQENPETLPCNLIFWCLAFIYFFLCFLCYKACTKTCSCKLYISSELIFVCGHGWPVQNFKNRNCELFWFGDLCISFAKESCMVYYLLCHKLDKVLATLNEWDGGLYKDFMLLCIIFPHRLKFWTSKYLFWD